MNDYYYCHGYCHTCHYWTSGGCVRYPQVYRYPTYTYTQVSTPKKRTIEKFDDKGNLIERITEER